MTPGRQQGLWSERQLCSPPWMRQLAQQPVAHVSTTHTMVKVCEPWPRRVSTVHTVSTKQCTGAVLARLQLRGKAHVAATTHQLCQSLL